ncbi:MAG: TIGR02996 domain-containing protein [Myxococcaceae bacterium]|nr:TIGR02996 domain-containing protein [Myxococcaceae bacterium]
MKKNSRFEAMLKAPWDDAPRLVYADWLSEQDDPRGEFIVVQCRLASGRIASLDAPQFEVLDLTYTRVTDAGAAAVLASPHRMALKEVSLRANRLTAAALAPVLTRKPALRLLNLKKNALTAAELKALEKRLPETRLSR